VLDDLGAIVIIALFYTAGLSWMALSMAAFAVVVLIAMNRAGVTSIAAYVLTGLVMWVCVLKSGMHATLAGVITALTIPARDPRDPDRPPLIRLEHALHPWVAYGILPLFAFANAGVSLEGLSGRDLLAPVPLGIVVGLFVGKQLGVFGFSWLALKVGIARLPQGVTVSQLYAAAVICGIGFTMSLFIGSLAFDATSSAVTVTDRLGILVGSLLSAVFGYIALEAVLPRAPSDHS